MARLIIDLTLPLLLSVLFMFALRPVARGVGLIDRPGGRKMHVGDVPVIGGLAMFLGLLLGGIANAGAVQGYTFFLGAVTVLVVVGALDDRYDLPASVRFLAQICAAMLMVSGADLQVKDIGPVFFGGVVELGWLSIPFTLVIVVTAINAFNMFDGSDGVAGIQSLIALIFLAIACVMSGVMGYLPVILCLAGCVLGFLLFNWPLRRTSEIRTFMGDAGSTMLGFCLAWLSIELTQPPARVISPVVMLWIFALPIYDFFSSMVRRVLMGRSPFHGDSEHLHHVLRRLGNNSRRVAEYILLGASALGGIGLGAYRLGVHEGVMFLVWLLTGVLYYMIFCSGLVIARRQEPREDDAPTGIHPTLWRQR